MAIAITAAGFTAGAADQLRRAMAAWRRKGGLEPFREQLVIGMLKRGYTEAYALQIFEMVKGFGDYGFPESHAASFALIVYVSAWLKCHHPAAFAAGLLNSMPLGFYRPAQIIYDAQRHGVNVYPVDVTRSDWYCTLIPEGNDKPAIRLGLQNVKELSSAGGQRLAEARRKRAFIDIDDVKSRADLDERDMNALSRADAFRSLAGHRRQALWHTLGTEKETRLLSGAKGTERHASLLAPTEGEDVLADYERLGLTLRSHPLKLLRPSLKQLKLISSLELREARPGQLVRATGIVINRQRPETASGVTFATLEDEFGLINVTIWRTIAERYTAELTHSRLMTVYGTIERDAATVYVVAGRLVNHTRLLGGLATTSRDFR